MDSHTKTGGTFDLASPTPTHTMHTPSQEPKDASQENEARLLRRYGRRPSQSQHFARHLMKARKYFDSGDYALSRAAAASAAMSAATERRLDLDVGVFVGSLHPAPEKIPHPHVNGVAGVSPILAGGTAATYGTGGVGGGGMRKSSLSVSM